MNLKDLIQKFEPITKGQIDPQSFDVQQFAQNLKSGAIEVVKTSIAKNNSGTTQFEAAMTDIAEEISATLLAMNEEEDPVRLAALKEDLEKFIPDQKDAAISALMSDLSSDAKNVLENLWSFLLKTAVIVATAFLLG